MSHRLSDEIRGFEAYMRLTPDEERIVQTITSRVKSILGRSLQDIFTMGSYQTGLATPLSDIDLTFTSPFSKEKNSSKRLRQPLKQSRESTLKTLRKIGNLLKSSNILHKTEVIEARVPIIKTQHRTTSLKIELQTMQSYRPAQEYALAYLNEMPSLRPLFIVIRHALEVRGLTTAFCGGLSSYPLLMMIATALKHSSGIFDATDLGGQLLYVLQFYGNANLYKSGFSANPPRLFDNLRGNQHLADNTMYSQDLQLQGINAIVKSRNPRKPYLLSLQDPADDSNDLGKHAYAIKHIQAIFIKAREEIMDSTRHGKLSALDYLVRANYRAFEIHRSSLARNQRGSKDNDYTDSRIEADFLRRVESHRKSAETGRVSNESGGGLDRSIPLQKFVVKDRY